MRVLKIMICGKDNFTFINKLNGFETFKIFDDNIDLKEFYKYPLLHTKIFKLMESNGCSKQGIIKTFDYLNSGDVLRENYGLYCSNGKLEIQNLKFGSMFLFDWIIIDNQSERTVVLDGYDEYIESGYMLSESIDYLKGLDYSNHLYDEFIKIDLDEDDKFFKEVGVSRKDFFIITKYLKTVIPVAISIDKTSIKYLMRTYKDKVKDCCEGKPKTFSDSFSRLQKKIDKLEVSDEVRKELINDINDLKE